MMNGHIRVESRLGEGSTFIVELPAEVAGDPHEAHPAQVDSRTKKKPQTRPETDTILVIDDDAAVRDLMARFVGKMGLQAVCAETGEEGIRLARELRPRVITLDVILPGLNGWDVLEKLKADPELASIPVIVITIVDNEAICMQKGAADYLVKPIDRDHLALTLQKYCGAKDEAPMELAHSRGN
jgi:CheY-like chemotaxis protein